MKEVYGKPHSVAVMRLTFLIGFLLCAAFALGQGSLVEGVTSITGTGNVMKVIPNAPIVVCSYPGTGGVPCTNLAQTYTTPTEGGTCPSNAQVITPTTANCSATSDAAGNFAFIVDSTASTNIVYYFKYQNTWNGPFARTNAGAGSGPAGVAKGSALVSNGLGQSSVYQSKPGIDVRDAGIDCTGATDSTAALNTLFASITGRQVNFPDVCQIRVTFSGGHGLVIQSQSSFVLHGNGHMVGTGGFVGPVIYGCDAAASGPVLYINRSGYGRIEGIGITARGPSPCTTSTFTGSVQVDSTGNPGVTTHNIIFDNVGLTSSAQGTATTNYIGLSITDGGKQNGEMIRVKNSWIHCQNSPGSISIDLENPTSDKDVFESNNFAACYLGVKHANGNATIKDNLFSSVGNFSVFGSNGAAIYIGACSSGPINILNNEVDSSGDFINSGNDGVGLGCNSGLNIEGNFLGISDPTPNNYVINIGNCCVQGYNLIGNGFLVTSNTSQYLVGSASQGLFGPLGYLYDLNNTLRSPTGSNSLGFSNFNFPFQSGEFHAPLSYSGNSISGTFGPNGTTPEFSSYSRVLFANSPHPSTQAQQSPFLAFRSWTGSIYDDWSFESEATGSGSQLALVHSKGTSTNNWFVAEGKTSGITLGTIATPVAPTGINVIGGGGATTYTYSLVDFGPNGNTLPSPTVTTAVGNTFASLNSSTYNQLLFGFQFGTTRVCVRREVGGTTQGYIGCVPVAAGNQNYSTQDNANTYEFRDTGLTGDGSAAPTTNTTGELISAAPAIFTFGDFGASPSSGIFSLTDTATTTTDTSVNYVADSGPSSRHTSFAARSQGVNQLQVCWQAGPQGETVIGSAVTCPTISQSPFAKLVVMSSTAAHSVSRLYQKNAAATGTMLEMNNATASSAAYNFFTACSGASVTDTSCSGGSIIASLRGDGLFTAASLAATNMTGGPFCVHETAGVLTAAAADCGTGGGTPGGATLSFQYNNAGAFGGITPPATVGVFIPEYINPTAATTTPIVAQVADCPAPTTITLGATTGIVAALDAVGCNIVHDRAATGAATLTIPTPTTLATPGPIVIYTNNSAQTDTLAPTTFTISKNGAPSAATVPVNPKEVCKVSVDPLNASTWLADCHAGATLTDGLFGSSAFGKASACETSFGATTLSTIATTTDTGLNCLPINAVIDSVVYRITTTITTAASFTIGDATTAARFCSTQSTLTAGTTGICFVQADQTGAAGPRQTAAAKVRVTSNVNPGAGVIRLIVYYHTWTAPTS